MSRADFVLRAIAVGRATFGAWGQRSGVAGQSEVEHSTARLAVDRDGVFRLNVSTLWVRRRFERGDLSADALVQSFEQVEPVRPEALTTLVLDLFDTISLREFLALQARLHLELGVAKHGMVAGEYDETAELSMSLEALFDALCEMGLVTESPVNLMAVMPAEDGRSTGYEEFLDAMARAVSGQDPGRISLDRQTLVMDAPAKDVEALLAAVSSLTGHSSRGPSASEAALDQTARLMVTPRVRSDRPMTRIPVFLVYAELCRQGILQPMVVGWNPTPNDRSASGL